MEAAIIVAVISTFLGAFLGGFATWLFAIPEKRKNEADKKAAQKSEAEAKEELRLIRRRAVAPYLFPNHDRMQGIYDSDAGNILFWTAGRPDVQCWARDEVDVNTPAGNPIIFHIENRGKAAPLVRLKLDGKPIRLCIEPDFDGANGIQFFKYPYDPAMHGKKQILEMEFESEGIVDTHKYETFHGHHVLVRIDPK